MIAAVVVVGNLEIIVVFLVVVNYTHDIGNLFLLLFGFLLLLLLLLSLLLFFLENEFSCVAAF